MEDHGSDTSSSLGLFEDELLDTDATADPDFAVAALTTTTKLEQVRRWLDLPPFRRGIRT